MNCRHIELISFEKFDYLKFKAFEMARDASIIFFFAIRNCYE